MWFLLKKCQFSKGIGLVEVAILLSVFSILTAGMLSWVKPKFQTQLDAYDVTKERMDRVHVAIKEYVARNHHLPCPAHSTYPEGKFSTHIGQYATSVPLMHYGAENLTYNFNAPNPFVNNFGVNYPGAFTLTRCFFIPDPDPTITYGFAYLNVGAVPFLALNLPPEYMYDGWGRKFRYHMSYYNCDAGGICDANTYKIAQGDIVILSDVSGGSTLTSQAVYALISFGSDNYEAYNSQGIRVRSGTPSANEAQNIGFTHPSDIPTYVFQPTSSTFHHIVTYRTKDQIEEKPGFGQFITSNECTTIANTIRGLNGNNFAAASNGSSFSNIAFWPGAADGFTGANTVLDVLWVLQDACNAYHGTARQCPNGAFVTYKDYNEYPCTCPNGNWNGAC